MSYLHARKSQSDGHDPSPGAEERSDGFCCWFPTWISAVTAPGCPSRRSCAWQWPLQKVSPHPNRGSWGPAHVSGCRDRAKGSLKESTVRVVSVERCPQKGSAAPGENVPHAQRGTQRVFYKEPGNSERVTAAGRDSAVRACRCAGAGAPVRVTQSSVCHRASPAAPPGHRPQPELRGLCWALL